MDPVYLGLAGFLAGVVNALAGGGPIMTLAAMTALGIDPRIANLTSTLALSPGQLLGGWMSRHRLAGLRGVGHSIGLTVAICAAGGLIGALLLLWTDPAGFRAVVPWLILFATAVYAWSGRGGSAQLAPRRLPGIAFVLVLGCLGIYGGYFGGGNSFLVLALLAATGLSDRDGAAVKNVLVAVINLGAVVVFAFSGLVDWGHAVALGLGGLLGSWLGVRLLDRIDPRWVRIVVILCGLGLSGWFFATQAS